MKTIKPLLISLILLMALCATTAFCEEALSVEVQTDQESKELEEELIQPRQTLDIEVYGERDLTRKVLVDSKGFITFPLIGRVELAGLTEEEATNKLYTLLERDYLVNPEVSLSARGSTTIFEELELIEKEKEKEKEVVLYSYVILGEVNKPGTYEFDSTKGEMTLLKAISIAGGFSGVANEKKIKLLKRDGEKTRALVINADSVLSGKRRDEVITDNDLILVPESFF